MSMGIVDRRLIANAVSDIEAYKSSHENITTSEPFVSLLASTVARLESAVDGLKAAAALKALENDETRRAIAAFDESVAAIKEEYDSLETEFAFQVQHKRGKHYDKRAELEPIFKDVFDSRSYKIRGSDSLQLPFFETFISVLNSHKRLAEVLSIQPLTDLLAHARDHMKTLISERQEDAQAHTALYAARDELALARRIHRGSVRLALVAERRESELDRYTKPLRLYDPKSANPEPLNPEPSQEA